MRIKAGNPQQLVCWRSLAGIPAEAPCCLAEKCVAYEPIPHYDQRIVTDAECDKLLTTDTGWQLQTQRSWMPETEKRNVMRRMVEPIEGYCGALPGAVAPGE